MRSYIRHPSDIPIQVSASSSKSTHRAQILNNISHGGLSFMTPASVQEGACIHLKIDSVKPVFETDGLVTNCRKIDKGFMIGIEFIRKDDLFIARMVEQVCHIEHYKREMSQQQGRELSGEEAAREWIAKYAANFPSWAV